MLTYLQFDTFVKKQTTRLVQLLNRVCSHMWLNFLKWKNRKENHINYVHKTLTWSITHRSSNRRHKRSTKFIQGLLLVVKQVNSVHTTYLSCHSRVQAELVSTELLKTLTLHDVPSPACDSCVPSNSQDEILQQLKTENHIRYYMESWPNNSKSF